MARGVGGGRIAFVFEGSCDVARAVVGSPAMTPLVQREWRTFQNLNRWYK